MIFLWAQFINIYSNVGSDKKLRNTKLYGGKLNELSIPKSKQIKNRYALFSKIDFNLFYSIS